MIPLFVFAAYAQTMPFFLLEHLDLSTVVFVIWVESIKDGKTSWSSGLSRGLLMRYYFTGASC